MAENFDLIFGQNASQQFTWNDTDYQNGWETIGNIPPTAAQFDALQRRNDTKTQELNTRLTTVEQSIAGGEGQKREPDTEYTVGTIKTYDDVPFNWVLECIVGGTSGSVDITIPSPIVEGARIIDGTVTWALRKIATYGGVGYRQSYTACAIGSMAFSTALPAGWYLECTTGGTTSASDLVITSPAIGNTVTDGTVVWTIREMASTADIPAPVDISGKANVDLNNLSAAGLAKIQQQGGDIIAGNLAKNGYVKFKNGLIMQWGYNNTNMNNNKQVTITYPTPFTNFVIPQAIVVRSGVSSYGIMALYQLPTLTSAVFLQDGDYGELGFYWFAIGK